MLFILKSCERIICICNTADAIKGAMIRNHAFSDDVEVWTEQNGEYRQNTRLTKHCRQLLRRGKMGDRETAAYVKSKFGEITGPL